MEKRLSLWLTEHQNKFNILEAKEKIEKNLPCESEKLCEDFNDFCDYLIEKDKTLRESRVSDELNLI